MPPNSARGSFKRTKSSVGGRGIHLSVSKGSVCKGIPLSVGRGNPSGVGRGSHSGGGRGRPLSVSGGGGRGSPSSVSGGAGTGSPLARGGGKGSPSSVSGGRGRHGITGSNTSMNVDLHDNMEVHLHEDSGSLEASHDGPSTEDVEIGSHEPRGSNTMDQVPTDPSNRIGIHLLGIDFAEPNVTRQIVAIFKNMFRGPWIKWTEVPNSHRDKLWNHFKQLYKWNPEIDTQVHKAWIDVHKNRYRDIMIYARDDAKKEAEKANVEVGTNFALLKPFKPVWINQEFWGQMIDKWNTPHWKNKSKKNKKNKNTLKNGVIAKHTGGSIKMSVIRSKMEKDLKRPPTYAELYTETRTKKKKKSDSGPREFITPTAKEDLEKYMTNMAEKFGPDTSTHPLGDLDAWERAVGGVKKGRIKGAPSDPGFIVTGVPSTQSASQLSTPNSAYVEEVVRLKEQVASLLEERRLEREEVEKAAAAAAEEAAAATTRERDMLDRMAAVEQMLAKFAPQTPAQ